MTDWVIQKSIEIWIAGASEKQLQAILDHDDLSKEDRDFVKAEMAKKNLVLMNSLVLDSLKKKNSMHTKERCRGLRVKNPDKFKVMILTN